LIIEIFQVVIIENVAAEGDPFVETSTNQLVDSVAVPVPLKQKVKRKEECEMLETAFTIPTSSERASASSGDDECRRLVILIVNLLRI